MLRILVVALVVLVAAMFLLPRGQRGEAPQTATELPEARPLADVRFVDKGGRETRLSDLKGDFTLLFFGFTNCPDVCPLTLSLLAQVRADIAGRAPRLTPRVLFVSVGKTLDSTGKGLLAHLSLLFIPASVGVIQRLDVLAEYGVGLAVALVASTFVTLVVTVVIFVVVSRLSGSSMEAGEEGRARD